MYFKTKQIKKRNNTFKLRNCLKNNSRPKCNTHFYSSKQISQTGYGYFFNLERKNTKRR